MQTELFTLSIQVLQLLIFQEDRQERRSRASNHSGKSQAKMLLHVLKQHNGHRQIQDISGEEVSLHSSIQKVQCQLLFQELTL